MYSDENDIDAPHFFDATVPQPPDAEVAGVSVSGAMSTSRLPGAAARAAVLKAVPNCQKDGGSVGGCSVKSKGTERNGRLARRGLFVRVQSFTPC